MSWWDYVQRIAPGQQQAEIAQAAGVTAPTVSRWRSSKQGVDPKAAANLARAYGRPVLEAFVAAGFLTGEEARQRPAAAPSYDQLTNDELLRLVFARMDERFDQPDAQEQTDGTATSRAEVSSATEGRHLRAARRTPPGERAEREAAAADREATSPPDPEGPEFGA